jgi:PKD repeat protein
VTTDGRGQETVGIDRVLRIDTRRPVVSVRLVGRARHGRASLFTASVADGTGSGVTSVEWDFGDGSKATTRVAGGKLARASHGYLARGKRTVRAVAVDQAGNTRLAKARVTVR